MQVHLSLFPFNFNTSQYIEAVMALADNDLADGTASPDEAPGGK